MPDRPLVYLQTFRDDVQNVIAWSEEHFGVNAAVRYAELIRQALHDIQADPVRPGASARPELAPNAYVYHLMYSRKHVTGGNVKAPRHFILYRFAGDFVELTRLLHDSRDLAQHVPDSYATG